MIKFLIELLSHREKQSTAKHRHIDNVRRKRKQQTAIVTTGEIIKLMNSESSELFSKDKVEVVEE